jgi:nitroreductase
MEMTQLRKNNAFNDINTGRRSIRIYDTNVKISKEEMVEIINEAAKAPSSVNMQPWRFVVVESKEGKEKLRPLVKFNINQLETSSAMIVIFGDLNSFDNAEKIYSTAVEKGYMPKEVKDRQLEALTNYYNNMQKNTNIETVLIDSSLVAMNLMLVARAHGYDTNPIGGFEREKIVEVLDLDKERYYPVMILSIGKAADEGYPSYRLPTEDITTWL